MDGQSQVEQEKCHFDDGVRCIDDDLFDERCLWLQSESRFPV
jgi:hypothetical protein